MPSLLKPATLAALWIGFLATNAPATANWPQFRGPNASGISDDPAPLTWNVQTGENIRWQTPIPGLGHAGPVIWENHIYIATAVKPGAKPKFRTGIYGDINSYTETEPHQWRLLCLNKSDGNVLWDKLVLESVPRTKRHTKSTHCNSTPSTDGTRIAAIFGSEGLFCFDMDGKELWRKDLGKMNPGFFAVTNTSWGFASSPVLHDGKIVVQCDVVSEQFLAAFDAKDGHELWRTPRKEVSTWCTPLIVATPERTQIVANGWKEIGGYDFATGQQLWNMSQGGDVPVASPILAGDLIILTSAHGRSRPMRGIRLDAAGDITPPGLGATNQSVVWCQARKGNYLETPIALKGFIWGDLDGIVTCFDAKTGEVQYSERIGGRHGGICGVAGCGEGQALFYGRTGRCVCVTGREAF